MYSPPEPPAAQRRRSRGRGVAIAAAAVVLAGAVAAGLLLRTSAPGATTTRARPAAPAPASAPAARRQVTVVPYTGPTARISDEAADRRRLTVEEVFPSGRFTLDGRAYTRDKAASTPRCEWTARGPLAAALAEQGCGLVVRATFVDADRRHAVTAGVAVLPTAAAARAVSVLGDPAERTWFRGMRGRTAENIDEALGRAALSVRGRYVVYAYATRYDGRPPGPELAGLAARFVGHAARPLDRRAAGRAS
ncbi:hypothetical protein DPM19_03915 [Actinomadura craniellae]|uniref:Uncharacterized protein n=1 Tax=Actinomadura craniellae TaxID=2231787 RepID=A0A365HAN4_9ACTN|nr:hypothetical protein [Actinomadura craniellae]RAY16089.1 hypothetical protein DPM19_03915 [Actinomadura craniellae]